MEEAREDIIEEVRIQSGLALDAALCARILYFRFAHGFFAHA